MISKAKIKDTSKKEEDFIYKKIKHNENVLICEHCKYERAETSLKDIISSMKVTDKSDFPNATGGKVSKTFKNMTVIRGRYDDVIGWCINWQ